MATSAYYEEQPVLDFMRGILGETYGEPLDRRQSEIFEKEMKSSLTEFFHEIMTQFSSPLELKIIQKGNQYVHEVIGITQSGADSLT